MIELEVRGTPAPKGSARAMMIGGKARLVAGSSNANNTAQGRWARAVREVALAQSDRYEGCALTVDIEFRLKRPEGHFGRGKKSMGILRPGAPEWPTTRPDVDKLARCTLDALVDTVSRGKQHYGIIDDDARIVNLTAQKVWAVGGNEGARIQIWPINPGDEDARSP